MSNDNVVVKFTQSWRGYSKGESAGFSADQAKALVEGKVAVAGKAGAPKTSTPAPAGKKGSGKAVVSPTDAGGAPDENAGSGGDGAPDGGDGGAGGADNEGKP